MCDYIKKYLKRNTYVYISPEAFDCANKIVCDCIIWAQFALSGEAEKRRSGEAENFTDPAHRVKYPVALFLHADDRAYTVCRGRMCYTLSHNISIRYIIKINKRNIVMALRSVYFDFSTCGF